MSILDLSSTFLNETSYFSFILGPLFSGSGASGSSFKILTYFINFNTYCLSSSAIFSSLSISSSSWSNSSGPALEYGLTGSE